MANELKPFSVKPLVWQKQNLDGTLWCSEVSVCGEYAVRFDGDVWRAIKNMWHSCPYDSSGAAMAAAQADYERRILSAIEPAPAAYAQVRREALEEAAKAATSFLVGDPMNGVPLRSPMAFEIAEAIRSLIQGEGK